MKTLVMLAIFLVGTSDLHAENDAFEYLFYNDSISGCTNNLACNYNETATFDDGSCIYGSSPLLVILSSNEVCLGDSLTLNAIGADSIVWNGIVANGTQILAMNSQLFEVKGYNVSGCEATISWNLQVHELPIVYAGSDVTVCEGGYVEFSATGANDYVWSNGVYNQYGALIFDSQEITVTGTDIFGCQNSDTLMVNVLPTFYSYFDSDGDGYGNPNQLAITCYTSDLFVLNNLDCDDTNPDINVFELNVAEICNGIDDNCNFLVDDGLSFNNYYYDFDLDGYGMNNGMQYGCIQPFGFVLLGGDCNELDANVNPGALELCNGFDENCNDIIDDNVSFANYYLDLDSDGFGSDLNTQFACEMLEGYSLLNNDCDDSSPLINPGASELCNSIDDDCDGLNDNGLSFVTYYGDADGDTYGNLNNSESFCADPGSPFVTNDADCDDSSPLINPGSSELCNSIDDDCDGVNDNGLSFVTYYGDADGDTYGDLNNSESYCADPGSPFVTNDADCDDTNASVNPGSTEIWENGIDDDCNPSTSDVSVEDYSIAEFTIFPNPVENLLTVSASNGILENVFIYNSIGMLLKIITPIDSLEVIDMSSWPSGQYIIRVGHLNKTIVKF